MTLQPETILMMMGLAALLLGVVRGVCRNGHFSGPVILSILGFIFLGGALLTKLEGRIEDRTQRENLQTLAKSAAAAIGRAPLRTLTGSEADLATPEYGQLKRQLTRMRESMPLSRFVYVMAARGDEVVFLADSEPHESEDCSRPGDVYDNASEALRRLLRESGSLVEGPMPDEWGTWVSGLASIRDETTGQVLGLVGVDIDSRKFTAAVTRAQWRAVGLTAAFCALLLTSAVFYQRTLAAAKALRESQQRLSLHIEQTLLGLIETDSTNRITGWNQAAQRIFGYTPEETIGRNVMDLLVSPHVRPRDYQILQDMTNARKPTRNINTNLTRDGRTITCEWCNTPLVDNHGRVVAIASMVQDITERVAMENQLRLAATADRLTGLPNRALFMDRLSHAMRRHRRDPEARFAVLFLDFDRFKIINDSLGHEIGDTLLTQIAQRLSQELREVDSVSRTPAMADEGRGTWGVEGQEDTDPHQALPLTLHAPHSSDAHTAGRLGGDLFVVLLEGIRHCESATIVADRLLTAIAQPYYCNGHELFCTASIGIVTSDLAAERPEDLLRDADTAMYEAKLAGKGRYAIFDVSMRQRIQERHGLENDLRRTLAADPVHQFSLAYQPILNLTSGLIESFEVLIRWRHPTRGQVSPAEFIPIAEETGLIVPLGEWIMQQACTQLARWRQLRPGTAPASLSINLSRRQLLQPELVERLVQIAAAAQIVPTQLHLEITESAVMQDAEHARRVLRDLKAAGFKLDMDDFGTGYSSLACLHQFPLDVLKIDRSFVVNLCRGHDFAALVNAIIMLARSLGIAVVAEGVETVDQVQLLQAMDCQYAQGYYFGKPAPIDQAMTFVPISLSGQIAAA